MTHSEEIVLSYYRQIKGSDTNDFNRAIKLAKELREEMSKKVLECSKGNTAFNNHFIKRFDYWSKLSFKNVSYDNILKLIKNKSN